MDGQSLSWLVSIVGFTGFIFAGKKKWWAWYINLGCQILWAAYALVTGQPAFLVFAAVYSVIFGVNAYEWTRDHRLAKKIWQSEPGAKFKFGKNTTITRLLDKPKEESNLVKHARTELDHIGEDPSTIDWYVKVIQEYSSFGHSGGSHSAILPVLTRLLEFKPLSPLTNDPREWVHHGQEVWGDPESNGIWQNKRDGRAFSTDGGETYYLVDEPNKSIHKTACNLCWDLKEAKCTGCGRNDYANLSGN